MVLQSNDVMAVHGNYMAVVCVVGATLLYGQSRMEQCTIVVENFAGLNIRGFSPTEVTEILSCCLAKSAYYLREALIFMEKLSRCP